MNVPVVSHLKLLVNLYNKMNNRFLVLLVIYLIIYLLSVLYKNKQIFCAILLSLLSWERGLKYHKHLEGCLKLAPSLLSWERGLKFDFVDAQPTAFDVAPLVGAWIEITLGPMKTEYRTSLLSWERGLKYYAYVAFKWSEVVAPLVGAWIEIANKGTIDWDNVVAPLVGAWIEIKE